MSLKIALVIEGPSLDRQSGQLLSKLENDSLEELCRIANFRPTRTFFAHRNPIRFMKDCFVKNPGGPLKDEYEISRTELIRQLEGYDLAVTMGPFAMFCLTNEFKLDTFRGTHINSPVVDGLQVVPTYAPYIFSRLDWGARPVVVTALRKATSRFEDIQRTIFIPESVADLYEFSSRHITDSIVADVETNVKCRITEFSISPSSDKCLYVSLESFNHSSTWSEADELDIWLWLHWLASQPNLSWGFHNATYDLTYLDAYGIRPCGPIFDTMLRHHGWQPEMEKSLGFLASLHIPTAAWKHLRTQAKKNYNKAGAL